MRQSALNGPDFPLFELETTILAQRFFTSKKNSHIFLNYIAFSRYTMLVYQFYYTHVQSSIVPHSKKITAQCHTTT